MENTQFDADGKSFNCVECNGKVSALVLENKPRPLTCKGCGTVYHVAKNPMGGMAVTVVTRSESEAMEHEEDEMEDFEDEEKDDEEENL